MLKIVIADDDEDVVNSFSTYFGLKEIDVVGVGKNGKEAFDLCHKMSPDFLILDLNMPDFDGFYTLKRFNEVSSSCKIIVYSGVIDANTNEKLASFPNCKIMHKPVNPEKLVEFLNNSQ